MIARSRNEFRGLTRILWLASLALLVAANVSADLVRDGATFLDQTHFGEMEEPGDNFGYALAAGDFDCDGIDDAVFGTPYRDLSPGGGDDFAQGQIIVAYGSSDGTLVDYYVAFEQGAGLAGEPETGDLFGLALAVGNFDGAGCDDLAIGVPGENVTFGGVHHGAGAVHVLYGWEFAGGLSPAGSQFFHRGTPGMVDVPEEQGLLGWSLAAADFDGDGMDDLAIGVPGDHMPGMNYVGSVHVIYGSPTGLDILGGGSPANHVLTQVDGGGLNEPDDYFGSVLAAGDFNGDGKDDLAVGVPSETVDELVDAGSVVIYLAGELGLVDADSQYLDQSVPAVLGQVGEEFRFGQALGVGDFDGDGFSDLGVGIPGHTAGGQATGQVQVFFGVEGGLSFAGIQALTTTSLTGAAPSDVRFGSSLVSGDFDGRGGADLAIGAVDDSGGSPETGTAYVLSGQVDRTFDYELTLYPASAAPGDFGDALGAGDFDDDGLEDLLVGNTAEDDGRGAAYVFYSHGILLEGFESGDFSGWSGVSP